MKIILLFLAMSLVVFTGLYAKWLLLLALPFVILWLYNYQQKKHSILRNFPLMGYGRWLMESIRPYVRQYFIESDTDGTPINRMFRSIVYQRAKNVQDTVAFGTKVDVYRTGDEWMGQKVAQGGSPS